MNRDSKISKRWQEAAKKAKYEGDIIGLRTFVQTEARKSGSRLDVVSSRRGLLNSPRAALCAAVWLYINYTETTVRHRLLRDKRIALEKVMALLADELQPMDEEVHMLLPSLLLDAPSSRRLHVES